MYPYKSDNPKQIDKESVDAADVNAKSVRRPRRGGSQPPNEGIHRAPHNFPHGTPPAMRPPVAIPHKHHVMKEVSLRGLKRCEGGLAYIWLRNDRGHWMHITDVRAGKVLGYVWTHGGWKFAGFDMRFIEGFCCFH
ncbi:MAG: hypothetical protein FWC95_08165 [Defluviitaleaceae bacterium]|nr:hypothetical protein [Defluviitaleaceae bacterium]